MSGSFPAAEACEQTPERTKILAHALFQAVSAPRSTPIPPFFDFSGVNIRQLVDFIVTGQDLTPFEGHVGNLISLALVPSAWPTQGLPALREALGDDSKNGVCGKAWNSEALAYKCKTCERDRTCVVCVECFKNGNHEGHDCAMITTSGGCCDCGDVQAWRRDGFCSNHQGAFLENEDPTDGFDTVLKRNLIDAVQAVALRIFSLSVSAFRPDYKPTWLGNNDDIVCQLLAWMLEVVECGDGIRRIVGLCLSDPSQWPSTIVWVDQWQIDLNNVSWLRVMMAIDAIDQAPKQILEALHKLYFQLITDVVFKKAFMEIFVDNYEEFLNSLVCNTLTAIRKVGGPEPEQPEVTMNITDNFSVQLFTVPSLVPEMLRRGGLLDVLLDEVLCLSEACSLPVLPYMFVPFAESSFANGYQSVLSKRLEDCSGATASSSTAPKTNRRKRRYFLPLPFPLLETLRGTASTQGSPDGCRRKRCCENMEQLASSWSHMHRITNDELASLVRLDPRVSAQEARHSVLTGPEEPANATREDHLEMLDAEMPDAPDLIPFRNLTGGGAHDRNPTTNGQGNEAHGQILNHDTERIESIVHTLENLGYLAFLREHPFPLVEGMPHMTQDDNLFGRDVDAFQIHREQLSFPTMEEQVAVFQSGLRHTPFLHEILSSNELSRRQVFQSATSTKFFKRIREQSLRYPTVHQGALHQAVTEARRMEELAILGTGPLAHTLRLDWPEGHRKVCENTLWKALLDLKYVITHYDAAFHLVHVRKDLFRKFVRILSIAQGMNPAGRKFGQHIAVEPDSACLAYNVEVEIFHLVEQLSEAFSAVSLPNDDNSSAIDLAASRLECIRIVRSCLDEWLDREEALEARSMYQGESFSVTHSVSIHLPLHRLLAFMVNDVLRTDQVDLETALSGGAWSTTAEDACRLVTHPLRISAFLAQVRAGMWKRNGRNIAILPQMYRNARGAPWFVDLDIFMQQCCAIIMGAEAFIQETQTAFRIRNLHECLTSFNSELAAIYASLRDEKAPYGHRLGLLPLAPMKHARDLAQTSAAEQGFQHEFGNTLSELSTFLPTVIEDLFIHVVRVASERNKCGYTKEQILRRELLHQLCFGDKKHSQLHWNMSFDDALGESIIDDIGDFVEPRGMMEGKYKLKDTCWKEFDPFESRLGPEDRNTAFIRQASIYKKNGHVQQVITQENVNERPTSRQFRSLFEIGRVACAQTGIVTVLLKRIFQQRSGSQLLDGALPAALHLVCMATEHKMADGEGRSTNWLEKVLLEGSFSRTALGVICELYKTSPSRDSSALSESIPVVERILRHAGIACSPPVKEILAKAAGGRGLFDGSGSQLSSSRNVQTSDRKRKLALRKELQHQMLAKMRRQQAVFAKYIDTRYVFENDKGAGQSQQPQVTPQHGAILEAMSDDDIPKTGVVLKRSRNAEIPGCALCHDSCNDTKESLLGFIGFHQKTRIPVLAQKQCRVPDISHTKSNLQISQADVTDPTNNNSGNNPARTSNANENERNASSSAALKELQEVNSGNKLRSGVEAGDALHLSFCGHAIHIGCFDRYFSSLIRGREDHHVFRGHQLADLDKLEFLCPVCRRLSNVVYPSMTKTVSNEPFQNVDNRSARKTALTLNEWMKRCSVEIPKWGAVEEGADFNIDVAGEGNDVHSSRNDLLSQGRAALQRLGLQGYGDSSESTEPKNDAGDDVDLISESRLVHSSAAMTTLACAEISARTIAWNDSSMNQYRKSLMIVVTMVRDGMSFLAQPQHELLLKFWRQVDSLWSSKELDAFTSVAFLFLTWPEALLADDVKMLVELGIYLVFKGFDKSAEGTQSAFVYDLLLYLRRCCIMICSYFDSLESPPLYVYGSTENSYQDVVEEIRLLLGYLELKTPAQLESILNEHPTQQTVHLLPWRFRPRRIGLVKLAHVYQKHLQEVDGMECISCNRSLSRQTVCLICGTLLCTRSLACVMAHPHAYTADCGKDACMKLVLNKISVKVTLEERRSHWGSLYLDPHGEEDENLRKGKPLYLSETRYAELERLWLTHAFYHDSRVLRRRRPVEIFQDLVL